MIRLSGLLETGRSLRCCFCGAASVTSSCGSRGGSRDAPGAGPDPLRTDAGVPQHLHGAKRGPAPVQDARCGGAHPRDRRGRASVRGRTGFGGTRTPRPSIPRAWPSPCFTIDRDRHGVPPDGTIYGSAYLSASNSPTVVNCRPDLS